MVNRGLTILFDTCDVQVVHEVIFNEIKLLTYHSNAATHLRFGEIYYKSLIEISHSFQ